MEVVCMVKNLKRTFDLEETYDSNICKQRAKNTLKENDDEEEKQRE